jgi:hypothetical protein
MVFGVFFDSINRTHHRGHPGGQADRKYVSTFYCLKKEERNGQYIFFIWARSPDIGVTCGGGAVSWSDSG